VKDRVARKHEQWFHFTKSERYYAAVDLIREPHKEATANDRRRQEDGDASSMPHGTGYSRSRNGADQPGPTGSRHVPLNPLGKLPGSVWTVATEPLKVPAELGIDHFAAFPTEWPRRIILGWAPTHGICTVCGEGLRPVVEKVGGVPNTMSSRPRTASAISGGRPSELMGRQTLITDYACACETPIKTPTGTRAADDPSRDTGRAGFNRPRGDAEGTTTTTLWDHNHWAAELRHSPHRARIEKLAARLYGPHAFAHWVRIDYPNGVRPIPVAFREALLRRGWLTAPPEMTERTTRPAVVLDPFGGTGTTAAVAKALGCVGISVDLSAAYCKLATWRTSGEGYEKVRARVEERTNGKPAKSRKRAA
jgi:hypothetical protein